VHPERITAIISQNGNAYEEGLSQGWNPVQKYWKEPTPQNRSALRDFLTPDATKSQYLFGVQDETLVAPEAYQLDSALLARPGNDEIQLAVWGKNDPFFLPPGAEAFKRDNPNAEVHFYDTGHFALETHYGEIADTIREFLNRKLTQASAA
jgi:pimeloyl-ACP methyl ester carboxylesterase